MIETIFAFLANIGFTHPVHPAFIHLPMGLVIGAVIFRLCAFLPRLTPLARTGYHCVVLALIGVGPAIFAGYLDWQHRFEGQWEFLIVLKMVLAGVLTLLLLATTIMDDALNPKLDRRTGFYLLMFLLVVGLGYSGGELRYG